MSTPWHIKGEEVGSCNCDWGCPCQFNALPTHGRCEALIGFEIGDGKFGDVSLDGVRFAKIVSWPGPIHLGDGTSLLIVDEGASPEQRDALDTLDRGENGGAYWEIFASVCPHRQDTVTAKIEFTTNRETREASVKIAGVGEAQVEPIRNPISGEEHRARINLPMGFEYTEAEMGNTVAASTTAADPLAFTLENSYAQLNQINWSNA